MAFILGGQEIEFELSNSPNFAEGKCETPKYHHHYLSCCDTCFPKLGVEGGKSFIKKYLGWIPQETDIWSPCFAEELPELVLMNSLSWQMLLLPH